jgi:hypothetical protein
MRLDRFDGVSDVAWVPDRYLASIVEGFFKGLDLTARMAGLSRIVPGSFSALFGASSGSGTAFRCKADGDINL